MCELRQQDPPNRHYLMHDSEVRAIVVQHRPHGSWRLVAGDVRGFQLIDPDTGRVRCRPVRTPHDCSAMAAMPDGRFVVGDSDGMLWLWDHRVTDG